MASYQVEITSAARREIRNLPGNVRQLIFREIKALEKEAHPHSSNKLRSTKGFEIPKDVDLRRIRMDHWRIVYVIEQELLLVTVLAVRKRPPYQYEDLHDAQNPPRVPGIDQGKIIIQSDFDDPLPEFEQ